MKIKETVINEIIATLNVIIDATLEMEKLYFHKISRVHPDFKQSAKNLIHYMALRRYDISDLQESLKNMGLTPFEHLEPHVMRSLTMTKIILQRLVGDMNPANTRKTLSIKKSQKLLETNTRRLFGRKSKKRRTRIMVTMPLEVAEDSKIATRFLQAGMNCARINCAHDDAETWQKMIANIKSGGRKNSGGCKIMMDLGGPKLRTCSMVAGPQVLHIRPERDNMGNVIKPARLWMAPPNVLPPGEFDGIIPVDVLWLKKVKRGDVVSFTDTRNKKCSLEVIKKQGQGRWAFCYDSAYIATGTDFILKKENKKHEEKVSVGELLPLEQYITLNINDILILHKDIEIPGDSAKRDEFGNVTEPAHVACTMPEIFDDVNPGEPILFDDGKIEGIIEEVKDAELVVKILNAKDLGSKLKAEKGINLPMSEFSFSGLTGKDREDLKFVVEHADAVNVSFVNDEDDVKLVLSEFEKLNKQIGLILKIETRKGYKNLPLILLEAMQVKPVGVMIARGDLAVEIGWNDMALVQEEILRVCEAAHVPDIWATQVLENMAKKGTPSRAEITDAGMSQRAECVMLNKGPQITKAIKMLDKILRNMQEIQNKKENALPRLHEAERLLL